MWKKDRQKEKTQPLGKIPKHLFHREIKAKESVTREDCAGDSGKFLFGRG